MKKKTIDSNQTNIPSSNKKEVDLPGYPIYPPGEDIYNNLEEDKNIDPENMHKFKQSDSFVKEGIWNEKSFGEDVSGDDLDIPGSDMDDEQEDIGSEDEENNYYSIGGDRHNDLEEDKGE
jgi:hypothetical protein